MQILAGVVYFDLNDQQFNIPVDTSATILFDLGILGAAALSVATTQAC